MVDQVPPNHPIRQFLSDPRNLATGLVFLASALQRGNDGESSAAHAARSAVGALGFRGGLDTGLKNDQERDAAIQAQRLEQSQRQENEQARIRLQQEGVGIQREGLGQNERLAKDAAAARAAEFAAGAPGRAAQANEANAQAGYYNRMPKEGSGKSDPWSADGVLGKTFVQLTTEEQKQAALEGRPFDPTKVMPAMAQAMKIYPFMAAGMNLETKPDGTVGIRLPGNPDGGPPPSAPVAAAPGALPIAPAAADVRPSLDLSSTTPQAPATERHGRGNQAPNPYEPEFQQNLAQVRALPTPQLEKFLKDPRLTKDQAVIVRSELSTRQRAQTRMGRNF